MIVVGATEISDGLPEGCLRAQDDSRQPKITIIDSQLTLGGAATGDRLILTREKGSQVTGRCRQIKEVHIT